MKIETVTCDGCGFDLTATDNCVDYRLVLETEGRPARSSFVTAMNVYIPLKRAHHFCNLDCLDYWRSREHAVEEFYQRRAAEWRAMPGNTGPGFEYSPGSERTAEWLKEGREVATTAFPFKRAGMK